MEVNTTSSHNSRAENAKKRLKIKAKEAWVELYFEAIFFKQAEAENAIKLKGQTSNG